MSEPPAPEQKGSGSTLYLNFAFFKVDPKWRWLNEIGKEEAAKEFASLIEVANTKIRVRVYSTLGLRADAGINRILWMPHYGICQGAFARAVWAHDGMNFALVHFEIQTCENFFTVYTYMEVLYL